MTKEELVEMFMARSIDPDEEPIGSLEVDRATAEAVAEYLCDVEELGVGVHPEDGEAVANLLQLMLFICGWEGYRREQV